MPRLEPDAIGVDPAYICIIRATQGCGHSSQLIESGIGTAIKDIEFRSRSQGVVSPEFFYLGYIHFFLTRPTQYPGTGFDWLSHKEGSRRETATTKVLVIKALPLCAGEM